MTGGDAGGYAGFHDQVNNHYGRLIGFGIGTALFSAAFQLSQPQQSSTNGTLSAQQTTAQQRSGSSSRSLACKSLLGT